MKLAISSTLVLLLGAIPVYAHQEPDKEKPPQQEEKKKEPDKKPQEKPQDEKHPPAEKGQPPKKQDQKDTEKKQQDERKNQEKQTKDQQKNQQQQQHEQQQDRQRSEQPQQDRARQDQQAQRNNGNNNRGGRRIPEERFHANFGSSHHFHVRRSEDRHFIFGGFTFEFTDAWPADWSYDDDVYVDEIDGEYYLIDTRHPGVRLLVVVVE
jgi:hypothetical protein